MAGPTVKEILLKWGIDASNWKSAVRELGSLLEQQQKKSEQAQIKAEQALERQKTKAKELLTQVTALSTQVEKQLKLEEQKGKAAETAARKAGRAKQEMLAAEKQRITEIDAAVTKLNAKIALEEIGAKGVLKARERIIAACEVEMQKLTALKGPQDAQLASLRQITAERQKQITLIARQRQEEEKRIPFVGPVLPKGMVLPAIPQSQALEAQQALRTRLAQGELMSTRQLMTERQRIVALANQELAAMSRNIELTNVQKTRQSQLVGLLERQNALLSRMGGGPSWAAGGAGGLARGLVGGALGSFGTVFGGVLTAQAVGGMLRSTAESVKELVMQSGPLEQLTLTFERLGKVRGTDTGRFLNQLRQATRGLVLDIPLLRLSTAAFQSDMRITDAQILQLTHDVVALARAQGHSADEAMAALQRAFIGRGRAVGAGAFAQLGRITGIQPAELMVQKFGAVLPQIIQRQEAFNKLLDVTHRKLLTIGDPALTAAERFTILEKEWERVREAFAKELVKTEGFRSFLGLLDDVVVQMRKAEEGGTGLANVIGSILKGVVDIVPYIVRLTSSLGELASGFGRVEGAILRLMGFTSGMGQAISRFKVLLEGIQIISVVGQLDLMAEALNRVATAAEFVEEKMGFFKQPLPPPPKPPPPPEEAVGGKPAAQPLDPAYLIKMAKLRLQLQVATDKEQLESEKERLQAEKDLNEQAYTDIKKTFVDYIETKKRLSREGFEATLKEAEADHKAKVEEIGYERQLAAIDARKQLTQAQVVPEKETAEAKAAREENIKSLQDELSLIQQSYNIRIKIEDQKLAATRARATAAQGREQTQLTDQITKARLAAAKTYAHEELIIRKEALNEEQQDLEHAFKEGTVSADSYLATRRRQILDERDLQKAEAEEVYKASQETPQALAQLFIARSKAEAEADKQLTKLHLGESATRLEADKRYFDSQEKIAQGALKIAQAQAEFMGPIEGQQAQVSTLKVLLQLEQEKLATQQKTLQLLKDEPLEWKKQYDEVLKTKEEILSYQKSLIDVDGSLKGLSGVASEMQAVFSSLPHTMGTRLAEAFGHMQQMLNAFDAAAKRTAMLQVGREQGGIRGLLGIGRRVGPGAVDITDPRQVLTAMHQASQTTAQSFTSQLIPAAQMLAQVFKQMADVLTSTPLAGEKPTGGTVPKLQGGGKILGTGMALVDAGEHVVTADAAKSLNQLVPIANALAAAFRGMLTAIHPGPPRPLSAAPAAPAAAPLGAVQTFWQRLMGINAPGGTPPFLSGPPTVASPLGRPSSSDVFVASENLRSLATTLGSERGGDGASGQLTGNMDALSSAVQLVTSSMTKLGDAVDTSTQKTDKSSDVTDTANAGLAKLSQVGQYVGGIMSTLSGQGGPAQAGLTGLSTGASLGAQLGSVIPGIGTAIGAAVGGAAGLITGLFAGAAEQATQKIARNMQAQFSALMNDIQGGTQTLTGGIAGVQTLITQTVISLTGRKGGGQELSALLPSMEQQLQALQSQQRQVLSTFQAQEQILNTPIQYQQSLGQIQQIIQAYQQYVQAGGSVADANQFLQQSFQNLVQQGLQQLNSDEQDAINNALHYNDLLLQRQNLIQDTNQQIQDIMSQGVAVQQMPAGVTKARQIEELMRTSTQQMDQLNEEISVSKYKLDNEQHIFDLATTRVGLETQLVVLQNQQTNLSLQQIEALGNTVSSLSKALPTSMPAALQQLGLGAAYVAPTPGQAPTPPIKTGIAAVDEQNWLQYQQALAYYNAQLNQPIGYINPAGTPAGTATIGTANQMYQGVPGTVPVTTPIPSTFGPTLTTGNTPMPPTRIGQPIGGPVTYKPEQPGTGLPGAPNLDQPNLTVGNQQIDTVATSAGNALLVSNMTPAFVPIRSPIAGPGGAGPGSGAGPPGGPGTGPGGGGGTTTTGPGFGNANFGFNLGPPFAQLPSNILIPTTVSTGPGTYQTTGIVGTLTSVANAVNDMFAYLAGLPGSPAVGGPSPVQPQPIITPAGGFPTNWNGGVPPSPNMEWNGFEWVVNTLPPGTNLGGQMGGFGPNAWGPGTSPIPPGTGGGAAGGGVQNRGIIASGTLPAPPGPTAEFEMVPQITDFGGGFSGTIQVGGGGSSWMLEGPLNVVPPLAAQQWVNQQIASTKGKGYIINTTPRSFATAASAGGTGGLPLQGQPARGGAQYGAGTGLPSWAPPGATPGPYPDTVIVNGKIDYGPSWMAENGPVGLTAANIFGGSTGRAFPTPPGASTTAEMVVASHRASVESTINQLSSTRVAAETQLVSMKMQEIQADMVRVQAWQQLLTTNKQTNMSNRLEDLINASYQIRGRQGFGGFFGEVANPTG